jgi:hypothetical protein
LALFAWVRFKEGRPFSSIGFRGENPVGKLFLGLLIGGGMMTVGVLVPWVMGFGLPVSGHGYATALFAGPLSASPHLSHRVRCTTCGVVHTGGLG